MASDQAQTKGVGGRGWWARPSDRMERVESVFRSHDSNTAKTQQLRNKREFSGKSYMYRYTEKWNLPHNYIFIDDIVGKRSIYLNS